MFSVKKVFPITSIQAPLCADEGYVRMPLQKSTYLDTQEVQWLPYTADHANPATIF